MKASVLRHFVLIASLASAGVIGWLQQTAKQPASHATISSAQQVPSAPPNRSFSSTREEAPRMGKSSPLQAEHEPEMAKPIPVPWSELEQLLQSESTLKCRNELMKQLPAAAAIDGPRAMALLLSIKDEPLRRTLFAPMLDAWADAAPSEALHWYHDAAQDELAAQDYRPSPSFYSKGFRAEAQQDIPTAAQSFSTISQDEDRLAALSAMLALGRETDQLPRVVESLGAYGELKHGEIALISATVGDSSGYTTATALLTPDEMKLLQAYLPPPTKYQNAKAW